MTRLLIVTTSFPDSVERLVAELTGAGRPVQLRGYLAAQQVADLLDWVDYVLIPSRIETIPVVFSDTMQAGRPVIATPVGDLPDLVGRYRCGVITGSATEQSYAAALEAARSAFR